MQSKAFSLYHCLHSHSIAFFEKKMINMHLFIMFIYHSARNFEFDTHSRTKRTHTSVYFGYPCVLKGRFDFSGETLSSGKHLSWKWNFFTGIPDLLHPTGLVATSKHGKLRIQTAPFGLSKPKKGISPIVKILGNRFLTGKSWEKGFMHFNIDCNSTASISGDLVMISVTECFRVMAYRLLGAKP